MQKSIEGNSNQGFFWTGRVKFEFNWMDIMHLNIFWYIHSTYTTLLTLQNELARFTYLNWLLSSGNPEYQRLYREFVKARHLMANLPKPTAKDKQDLEIKVNCLAECREMKSFHLMALILFSDGWDPSVGWSVGLF